MKKIPASDVLPFTFCHEFSLVLGLGTDHAWGGNHFIVGGSVKGGLIHGQYPGTKLLDVHGFEGTFI